MAKFVNLAEAATRLNISPEQLNDLRQQQQIYGYRDGASWKFKPEDVDRLAESLAAGTAKVSATGGSDADMSLADSGELTDSSFELSIDEPAPDVAKVVK